MGVVQHDLDRHKDVNWLHRAICEDSSECVGLDIDARGVEHLKQQGYRVVCADAESFDLNEEFDVIVAGDIIEHLSNPGAFLNAARRHLKEDGVLLLSTPNPFWWKVTALTAIKGPMVNPQHTCWFCEQTLTQLLERHGFQPHLIHYGSVYYSKSLYHKVTQVLEKIPMPNRFRYNTLMVAARIQV